jgi:dolichol kinase
MEKGLKKELGRFAARLTFTAYPITYYFAGRTHTLLALLVFLVLSYWMHQFRTRSQSKIAHALCSNLRFWEREPSWLRGGPGSRTLCSLIACLWVVSEPSWVLAVGILIFGDAAAAWVGLRFGTPLPSGKSLAGSCAFLVTSILVSLGVTFLYHLTPTFLTVALAASAVATLIELCAESDKGFDDNVFIPIAVCTIMFLG